MSSVLVCLPCRVDVDGFPDRGEALDAAVVHDEDQHGGHPVAFVVSPEPVWLSDAVVPAMPSGGKGAPAGSWGGAVG